ncbi:hypothetical protein WS83_01310 [Burkholderia sp. MSMB2042]|nr:hypothetical protein WS78_10260 [Burkholderia savannae]KVG39463.1 hypothetical protein WS77_19860 [Burkholderia sp. MSMB0265]KVG79248.1 hypothetical protein WS81_03180 [Burkholderia sp. MSMB2040]KVG93289.1 hypothetical protein WS83_01310 [Burkholderia sp. MSMB2042]KVG98125.1 hypothetical protein WS82_01025 [Burkholderia sp. MSMB2041]
MRDARVHSRLAVRRRCITQREARQRDMTRADAMRASRTAAPVIEPESKTAQPAQADWTVSVVRSSDFCRDARGSRRSEARRHRRKLIVQARVPPRGRTAHRADTPPKSRHPPPPCGRRRDENGEPNLVAPPGRVTAALRPSP